MVCLGRQTKLLWCNKLQEKSTKIVRFKVWVFHSFLQVKPYRDRLQVELFRSTKSVQVITSTKFEKSQLVHERCITILYSKVFKKALGVLIYIRIETHVTYFFAFYKSNIPGFSRNFCFRRPVLKFPFNRNTTHTYHIS